MRLEQTLMVSTQSAEDKLQALMIQKPLIIDIKPCSSNLSNETFEYHFANFDERCTDCNSVWIA